MKSHHPYRGLLQICQRQPGLSPIRDIAHLDLKQYTEVAAISLLELDSPFDVLSQYQDCEDVDGRPHLPRPLQRFDLLRCHTVNRRDLRFFLILDLNKDEDLVTVEWAAQNRCWTTPASEFALLTIYPQDLHPHHHQT